MRNKERDQSKKNEYTEQIKEYAIKADLFAIALCFSGIDYSESGYHVDTVDVFAEIPEAKTLINDCLELRYDILTVGDKIDELIRVYEPVTPLAPVVPEVPATTGIPDSIRALKSNLEVNQFILSEFMKKIRIDSEISREHYKKFLKSEIINTQNSLNEVLEKIGELNRVYTSMAYATPEDSATKTLNIAQVLKCNLTETQFISSSVRRVLDNLDRTSDQEEQREIYKKFLSSEIIETQKKLNKLLEKINP